MNTGHNSGGWLVKVYPGCGEASVSWAAGDDSECSDRWAKLDEAERERANWERANRRAAANLRRYMVENGLVFMWVLTVKGEGLHGPEGRAEVMRRCGEFARVMRADFGVTVYAYSPELHPNGHGWHVNFFVPDRLPHALVKEAWGHGFVWVSDWRKKVKKRPGRSVTQLARAAAASAARYAAKYAEKDWSREVLTAGAHRYERSEGHDPVVVEAEASHVEKALRAVFSAAGDIDRDTVVVVWSNEVEDYYGPPWVFLRWEPVR